MIGTTPDDWPPNPCQLCTETSRVYPVSSTGVITPRVNARLTTISAVSRTADPDVVKLFALGFLEAAVS